MFSKSSPHGSASDKGQGLVMKDQSGLGIFMDLRKSTASKISMDLDGSCIRPASFLSVHARQCLNGPSGRGRLRSSQLLLRGRTKQAGKGIDGIDMPRATSSKGLHAFWMRLSLRQRCLQTHQQRRSKQKSFSAVQDASRVGVTNHHSAIHLDEMEGDWAWVAGNLPAICWLLYLLLVATWLLYLLLVATGLLAFRYDKGEHLSWCNNPGILGIFIAAIYFAFEHMADFKISIDFPSEFTGVGGCRCLDANVTGKTQVCAAGWKARLCG